MNTEITINEIKAAPQGSKIDFSYGGAYQYAKIKKIGNCLVGSCFYMNYDTFDFDEIEYNIDLNRSNIDIMSDLPLGMKNSASPYASDFESEQKKAANDIQFIVFA